MQNILGLNSTLSIPVCGPCDWNLIDDRATLVPIVGLFYQAVRLLGSAFVRFMDAFSLVMKR